MSTSIERQNLDFQKINANNKGVQGDARASITTPPQDTLLKTEEIVDDATNDPNNAAAYKDKNNLGLMTTEQPTIPINTIAETSKSNDVWTDCPHCRQAQAEQQATATKIEEPRIQEGENS